MISIERIGMVRPAGWSGCGSSPTVLPSRRGGIIGRLKGATFESKLTGESPIERKGSHHFHREPCACYREVSGEASVAACAG